MRGENEACGEMGQAREGKEKGKEKKRKGETEREREEMEGSLVTRKCDTV